MSDRNRRAFLVALVVGGAWVIGPGAGSALAAAPVCNSNSYTVANTDTLAFSGTANCSDADDDAMTASLNSGPTHGFLSPDGSGGAVYQPNPGYVGPDSFTFHVVANGEQSNVATISITVTGTATNQPPSCVPTYPLQAYEGKQKTVSLPCSDPDTPPNQLVGTILTEPAHGDAGISGLSLNYTADDEYVGSDSFTFKVNDGTSDSGTVTVTVDVLDFPEGNQAPTCPESHAFVEADSEVTLIANCLDPEGDGLTYGLASPSVQHGAIDNFTSTSVRYRPAPGFTGTDSLGYSARDAFHDPITFVVEITVLPVGAPCCESAPEATPAQPYAASISSPVPGPIYIDTRSTTEPAPTGFTFLDREFDITAPEAVDADDPLRFVFKLDAAELAAAGVAPAAVRLFRDGAAINGSCPPVGSRANPTWWPCEESRLVRGDGDLWITVLTMHASVWNVGVGTAPPDADSDGVPDSTDNCVNVANPAQLDADEDEIGAACDTKELPTNKDECKKDGWKAFNGRYTFKNQGDCVSFVATGGKNPAAPPR